MSIGLIRVGAEELFDEIKLIINPLNYIECGKCGAIKVDTQEVVMALSIFYDLHNNEEGEIQQSLHELINGWISAITEPEPDFDSIPDWDKWDKENAHRKCDTLESRDHDIAIYARYPEIVLRFNETCNCFSH